MRLQDSSSMAPGANIDPKSSASIPKMLARTTRARAVAPNAGRLAS